MGRNVRIEINTRKGFLRASSIVENINADLYITTDNEKVGTLMGEALIKACPEGGNIFAINGSPTDRNVDEVVKGFNKAIENSNLNVVYTGYCDNWLAELAFENKLIGAVIDRFGRGVAVQPENVTSAVVAAAVLVVSVT